MFTCNETICSDCSHIDVCKYKDELLTAQEAVNNVTVIRGEDKDDYRLIKLRDISWIKDVQLECIFFQEREETI